MHDVGLKYAVFLLALLSLASAEGMIASLPAALGVVVTIVVISLALTYMLSETLNNQQLTAWVKSELRELIVAAILFAIVFAVVSEDTMIGRMLTGTDNYKQVALDTVNGMISRATTAYVGLIRADHAVSMLSGFSTSLVGGYYVFASFGGAPTTGFSSFMVFFNQAATGLSNMIFIYTAMKVLLGFFLNIGPKLLYLAFIFRFIPFTRQLGNTMVALVIGAYVIFPFSLYLLSLFHQVIEVPSPELTTRDLDQLSFNLPVGSTFICGDFYIRFLVAFYGELGFALPPCIIVAIATLGAGFANCMSTMMYQVYPIIMSIVLPIVWGVMLAFSSFFTPDIADIFGKFLPFFRGVNNLGVISYIDILLVAIITYVGTKSVSVALGGEYMLPGIQRLI